MGEALIWKSWSIHTQLTSNAQILALRENQRISAYLKSRTNITTQSLFLCLSPLWWPSQMHYLLLVYPQYYSYHYFCVCVCVCGITKLRSYRSWAGTRASHKQFIFSNALQWATPFYSLRYLATFSCYLSGENYFIYK